MCRQRGGSRLAVSRTGLNMSDQQPGIDEGYIKYVSDWTPGPAPDAAAVDLLNRWRKPLWEAGLVGHYVISGTQTGHIADTSGEHYALVTAVNIAGNSVSSIGHVKASSESLTHAAIYALSERINAVVHVHSEALWKESLDQLPTTRADVPYGTPEMAEEFGRLWRETDFANHGLAVMAGHDEGLVSIGGTLEEAATRMLELAEL